MRNPDWLSSRCPSAVGTCSVVPATLPWTIRTRGCNSTSSSLRPWATAPSRSRWEHREEISKRSILRRPHLPGGEDKNDNGGSQRVVNSLNNNFVDRRALLTALAPNSVLLTTAVWLPVGGPALLPFVLILLALRMAATWARRPQSKWMGRLAFSPQTQTLAARELSHFHAGFSFQCHVCGQVSLA